MSIKENRTWDSASKIRQSYSKVNMKQQPSSVHPNSRDLAHYVKLPSVNWVVRRKVVFKYKVFRPSVENLHILKPAENRS